MVKLILSFLCVLAIDGAWAAPASVLTYHNDAGRTGWNQNETVLTASNIPKNFGILQTVALDEQVSAQPLVVPGIAIAGGTHDVVYVMTENNSIYAIDASTGTILISTNLGAPVPFPLGCGNNSRNVGITSTPVIDPATNIMYVIAYLNNGPSYQIHALNIFTLADTVAPVTISATHVLANGTTFNFNATVQRQRPGLLLLDGVVYAGFGSFCDYAANQSRGWLLGWHTGSLTPLSSNALDDTLASSPANFFLSSIWMSGYGIAGSSPVIYFVTGNSDGQSPPGVTDVKESVVKLMENSLAPVTGQPFLFTKPNSTSLDNADEDFGSGGIMLLPDQAGSISYLAVAAGKDGILYLFNRLNLSTPLVSFATNHGCWCGPSYFVGPDGIQRVITSHGSTLQTWHVNLTPTPNLSVASTTGLNNGGQDPGFFTSVSSNGLTAGSAVIWAVGHTNPLTLYAFAATAPVFQGPLTLIYSGAAGSWPYTGGNANVVPTVANGKVYVASYKALTIFGLGIATPVIQPSAATAPARIGGAAHLVSGVITAINGPILTLQTRSGHSKVDDAQAIANERASLAMSIGMPITVQGKIIEGNGALQATAIVRAKPSNQFWPPDQ